MAKQDLILVVTRHGDAHAQHILGLLRKKGHTARAFDYSYFPGFTEISFNANTQSTDILSAEGHPFFENEVKSVFNRRQAEPKIDYPEGAMHNHMAQESQHFLENLPELLPCFWLSHPDYVRVASRKPYQLKKAADIGLDIPETLISNSPRELREFVESLGGRHLAVKNLFSSGVDLGDKKIAFFCEKLEPQEVLSRAVRAKNCPLIYQEYVDKDIELRITVVGEKVIACGIDSKKAQNPDTRIDWRHYDPEHVPHFKYDLPPDVQKKCVDLTRSFNLFLACIDMILTPGGDYVFLEMNPNGQWIWLEHYVKKWTGQDLAISEAIADLLISPPVV